MFHYHTRSYRKGLFELEIFKKYIIYTFTHYLFENKLRPAVFSFPIQSSKYMALFGWTSWSRRNLFYICISNLAVWKKFGTGSMRIEDEWNLWGEGALYDGYYTEWWLWLVLSVVIVLGMPSSQGVTKRCRLSLLTNSALAIRVNYILRTFSIKAISYCKLNFFVVRILPLPDIEIFYKIFTIVKY